MPTTRGRGGRGGGSMRHDIPSKSANTRLERPPNDPIQVTPNPSYKYNAAPRGGGYNFGGVGGRGGAQQRLARARGGADGDLRVQLDGNKNVMTGLSITLAGDHRIVHDKADKNNNNVEPMDTSDTEPKWKPGTKFIPPVGRTYGLEHPKATGSSLGPGEFIPDPNGRKLYSKSGELLFDPTKVCVCFRPLKRVLCRNCGYCVEGRVRCKCEAHPKDLYLLDISGCPKPECLGVPAANNLIEYNFPPGYISKKKNIKM